MYRDYLNMDRKLSKSDRRLLRKRGRPAGKNRVPLTLEERRARNAQYERERRIELTDALAELAEAAGCDTALSSADLLATVISQLARASRFKHSSDIGSLRRCNKNLMAQIADLEQRLASDPGIFPPQAEESVEEPRHSKWDTFEAHETECTPLPKYSPLGNKHSPLRSFSPEQKYLPDQRPSPDQVYLPERNFVPEPKYSPKHEFLPVEQHLPTGRSTTTHQLWLPAPKLSPLSDSSGPLSPEQGALDCSSYQFADAQVPTPEYRISSNAEYSLPDQHCPLHHDGQRGFSLEGCSGLTSHDPYVPPTYLFAVEPHFPAPYIHQPLAVIQPPIQQDIFSNLGALTDGSESIMPDIDYATSVNGLDLLSTEDLISVYL